MCIICGEVTTSLKCALAETIQYLVEMTPDFPKYRSELAICLHQLFNPTTETELTSTCSVQPFHPEHLGRTLTILHYTSIM